MIELVAKADIVVEGYLETLQVIVKYVEVFA